MIYNRRDIIASLQCMRCGSRKDVNEYLFSKIVDSKRISKYKTQYTWANIYIPICYKCQQDFRKHSEYASTWSGCGFCSVCFILFLLFITSTVNTIAGKVIDTPWQIIMILLVILDIIFFVHLSYISLKAHAMVENPNKYMKFKRKIPFVKPMDAKNWVPYSEWLKNAESKTYDIKNISKNEETIYTIPEFKSKSEKRFCGNCGKPISSNEKYCFHCGSLL